MNRRIAAEVSWSRTVDCSARSGRLARRSLSRFEKKKRSIGGSIKIGKLRRITSQQLAEFVASLEDAIPGWISWPQRAPTGRLSAQNRDRAWLRE